MSACLPRSSAPVDDLRWFASNAYTSLVVPELRSLGLAIATEGDRPARLALAMSGVAAEQAWRYARAQGTRLLVYLWDLPPTRTRACRSAASTARPRRADNQSAP